MSNTQQPAKKATAVMVSGTNNTLMQTLGVPYGVIFKEGLRSPVSVYTTEHLKQLLRNSVEKGIITGDNAGELEATAEQIGLLADDESINEAIKSYEPPQGEELRFTFRVCDKQREMPLPPHGHIYVGEDSAVHAAFFDTTYLEKNLHQWIDDESMTPVNAAVILRDAMRAGIPENGPSINEGSFNAALSILAKRMFGSEVSFVDIRGGF